MGMNKQTYIDTILRPPKEIVNYINYLINKLGFEGYSVVRNHFIRFCSKNQITSYNYIVDEMIYRYCVIIPKKEYAGEKIILKSSRFYVCEIG